MPARGVRLKPGAGSKLVSVKQLALPRIAQYAIGFRIRIDAGKPIAHVFIDMLFFGKGRTEVSLVTTSLASAATRVGKAELTLARRLTRRIRA